MESALIIVQKDTILQETSAFSVLHPANNVQAHPTVHLASIINSLIMEDVWLNALLTLLPSQLTVQIVMFLAMAAQKLHLLAFNAQMDIIG